MDFLIWWNGIYHVYQSKLKKLGQRYEPWRSRCVGNVDSRSYREMPGGIEGRKNP